MIRIFFGALVACLVTGCGGGFASAPPGYRDSVVACAGSAATAVAADLYVDPNDANATEWAATGAAVTVCLSALLIDYYFDEGGE